MLFVQDNRFSGRDFVINDAIYRLMIKYEEKKMRISFKDYPREVYDVMMSGDFFVIYNVYDEKITFYDYAKNKVRVHSFTYPACFRNDDRWHDCNDWQKMMCGRLWHEYLARTISGMKS